MKFKLDENFGTRTLELFKAHGHDVETVRSQNLQGCSDQHLYEVCCTENRCLVSLDLDFADVVRFPPSRSSGLVVIRVPHNPSLALLEQMARQFLGAAAQIKLENRLLIVEVGRIRIHESDNVYH